MLDVKKPRVLKEIHGEMQKILTIKFPMEAKDMFLGTVYSLNICQKIWTRYSDIWPFIPQISGVGCGWQRCQGNRSVEFNFFLEFLNFFFLWMSQLCTAVWLGICPRLEKTILERIISLFSLLGEKINKRESPPKFCVLGSKYIDSDNPHCNIVGLNTMYNRTD